MALGRLGKYERLDVLGHGSSGIVYLARDTLLGKQVALKEIAVEGEERERFLTEARVLDRLKHPNIVKVNSVDQIDGRIVIDMEYVRGQSLYELLRRTPQLPARRAFNIASQICDGLSYAHSHRTVHRDIKPANILVTDSAAIKIIDFGLAEVLGTLSLAHGAGTYAYMAPEDFESSEQSDRRSDIWAVGVVLYEMLAGVRPFRVADGKDPFAWKEAIQESAVVPITSLRGDLPPEIDAIIDTALARRKELRYEEAAEMGDSLRALLSLLWPAAEPGAADRLDPAADEESIVPSILAGVNDIDSLLTSAPFQWDAVCSALSSGTLERWLRGLGEAPMADVVVQLSKDNGTDDDRLREFLYQCGVELEEESARLCQFGMELLGEGRSSTAFTQLKAAWHLDPESAVVRAALTRAAEQTKDRTLNEWLAASHKPSSSEEAPAVVRTMRSRPTGTASKAQNGGTSLDLSLDRVDFGRMRLGQAKTVKVELRHGGRGAMDGRVLNCPAWIHVSPAQFTVRKRQVLSLTAQTSTVWTAPADYAEKVVLETSSGRKEIDVAVHVDLARKRLADIASWYVPLFICCLLPVTAAILTEISHPESALGFWQPGFIATGLLCGAFFALTVTADTAFAERFAPFSIMIFSGIAVLGLLDGRGDPLQHAARVAVLQTGTPAVALIILQAIAVSRDPNGWGRWQLWRWIIGISAILITYGLQQSPQ